MPNHPACAFKGIESISLMAQAPRLAKAGSPPPVYPHDDLQQARS
jgi:hypothetical protein